MGKLTGRVALVTGASGEMGHAICSQLAEEGASLILHGNSRPERAQELQESLSQQRVHPQQHMVLQADLTQEDEARRLIREGTSHFGRLDMIVNNAGWTRVVKAENLDDLDEDLLNKTLQLKIHGPLYLIRAARPWLESSGQGQVINITSVAGIAARGSSIIYAAANAALSNMTRSLARALAPNIRVNAVAPGFVETGFAWPKDGQTKAQVAQRNHIRRTVEADEVARVVRFLACDAPAITGEEIVIDGGIARLGVRA